MKKIKLLILSLLCLVCFTGCSSQGSASGNGSGTINLKYGIVTNEVESYDVIDSNYIATTVANIVMPATVEITCTVYFTYQQTYGGFFSPNEVRTISTSESCQATGFIINEEGYVLTNAHVLTSSNEAYYKNITYTKWDINLNYADSNVYFSADVIAYDTSLDLAVLKMDVSTLEEVKYVTFFNITDDETAEYLESNAVKLYYGEVVIAIGNANGYGISVTQGIVSAPIRRFTKSDNTITKSIQIDAAINEGNSGGPLANMYGAIIGINSFKIVTDTSEGLGYAIPTDVILSFINDVNNGEYEKINAAEKIVYYYTNERKYESTSTLTN